MRRGTEAMWQGRAWPTRGASGEGGTDTWQEATWVHADAREGCHVVSDMSFSCVVKHKDDGQTKFIKPNSQRQDIIIKYWVSIGSIHREQG